MDFCLFLISFFIFRFRSSEIVEKSTKSCSYHPKAAHQQCQRVNIIQIVR